MRSIFVLLIISMVLFACKNSSAPVDLGNQQAVKKALSNRWESEYMETFAARTKVHESLVSQQEYKEDGTFSGGKKDGMIVSKGKWNYDPKEQSIKYSMKNINYSTRILKLTGKELILSQYTVMNDEIRDSTIVTYKKL